ncbi:EAL domain-containing protein [Caulobacter sp. DWR1-3-2b1]|uniref:EAL domain-containing protein n=1 Tax=Caulobacter sp. DWR1-3-2b1 TaxID=2804670 RepID=UPI003CE998ED
MGNRTVAIPAAKARGPSHDLHRFDLAQALLDLEAGHRGLRAPLAGPFHAEHDAFNRLAEHLDRAPPADLPASLLILDLSPAEQDGVAYIAILGLDGFSRLRRQIGSQVAGQILKALGERVRLLVPGVKLGRIGRTNLEFAFRAYDDLGAESLLCALRLDLDRRLDLTDGQSFDLDVALGAARRDQCGEFVIDCAAEALVQAQSHGAKVQIYREEDRERAAASLALLRDLRQVIEQDGLALAYQPKLRLSNDRVEVVEALVRWKHPVRGAVSPDEFIGLAEQTGLIDDLTRWVVRRALADQEHLRGMGLDVEIHINLSGQMVADAAFALWLLEVTERHSAGRIGLEITETAVINEPERALANLQSFAAAGLKIAIDDYGSGLSSLSYLKQIPAHELKIDRLFISQLTSSHRDPLLVRSTIDLAHALGMEVTAEGVEDSMTLALLKMMGCDLAQGYLVSPALELDALVRFIQGGFSHRQHQDFCITKRNTDQNSR